MHIKLETSGLDKYFPIVINSEVCGFKKPDVKIFDYAFKVTSATNSDSIMIGDDWDADITGAMNAGMPYIWFNPKQKQIHLYQKTKLTVSASFIKFCKPYTMETFDLENYIAVNESVYDYEPGSPERARLIEAIKEARSKVLDIPMIIGGKALKPIPKRRFLLLMTINMYLAIFTRVQAIM